MKMYEVEGDYYYFGRFILHVKDTTWAVSENKAISNITYRCATIYSGLERSTSATKLKNVKIVEK